MNTKDQALTREQVAAYENDPLQLGIDFEKAKARALALKEARDLLAHHAFVSEGLSLLDALIADAESQWALLERLWMEV